MTTIRVADERAQGTVERFLEIAGISRASGQEEGMGRWLLAWARERGLAAERDGMGNVRIDVASSAGRESEGAVILQAHQDMVAAPDPDGLPEVMLDADGRTMRARASTLGADDGIGIAIILGILESPPESHPALRAIFTTEEETTMRGAEGLREDWLEGAQGLLNVDWETAGEACVASAGCKIIELSRVFESWEEAPGAHAYVVALRKYPGGHSGMDIGRGVPNPVLVLARSMGLGLEVLRPRLHAFVGGMAGNAIPQNAIATFMSDHRETPTYLTTLRGALLAAAPAGAEIPIGPAGSAAKATMRCLSAEDSAVFMALLGKCPAGVLKSDAEGRPEVSANVGAVSLMSAVPNTAARIVVTVRAHEERELAEWCEAYRRLGEEFGFECSAPKGAEPWKTEPSAWLDRVVAAGGLGFRAVKAHVGLECSVFARKMPGLPMASVGPTIRHPHSLNETLDTGTITETEALLRQVIEGRA